MEVGGIALCSKDLMSAMNPAGSTFICVAKLHKIPGFFCIYWLPIVDKYLLVDKFKKINTCMDNLVEMESK